MAHGSNVMLTFASLNRIARRQRTREPDQQNPLLEFRSEADDDSSVPDGAVVASTPHRSIFLIPAIIVVALALAGMPWRLVANWVQTPASALPASALPPSALPGAAPPASVLVLTEPAGAQVSLDGQPRGVTPLTLHVPAGTYALSIRNHYAERSMTLTASAGADIVREIDLGSPVVKSTAVAPPGEIPLAGGNHVVAPETATVANVAGWLSVQAPFELQVLDAGEVVGSSSLSRIMLPAGRRDLELVNRTLEFHERRRIEIAPGKTAAVTIAAPRVAININARPWADVSVDGVALGQTPIANVMMAIGSRQLVFRHPELGERRQDVLVTSRPGQRISLDLTK